MKTLSNSRDLHTRVFKDYHVIGFKRGTSSIVWQLWACLADGFNAPALGAGLNLTDKQVDAGCWLRSELECSRTCCKPLLGSYQLWTFRWSDILCAMLGLRAINKIYPFSIFFHRPAG